MKKNKPTNRQEVFSFQKNRKERLVADRIEMGGKWYLSLRVYYRARDGELRHTTKGFLLRQEQAGKLVEAAQLLAATVEVGK